MTGAGNGTIFKLQAILTRHRLRLIGEPGFVQCLEKPVATSIAGKHAARPVRSVCSRSKSHNQQSSFRITKVADWSAPIHFVAVRRAFLNGHCLAMFDQPRTSFTFDNAKIQTVPCRRRFCCAFLCQVILEICRCEMKVR